jgi:predicted ATP-binding protein involved in virulence
LETPPLPQPGIGLHGGKSVKLIRLELENYRCFPSLTLELDTHLTLLVARNGQGKTSLLDAIKVALWPYVRGFDLGSTTNDITGIHPEDVFFAPPKSASNGTISSCSTVCSSNSAWTKLGVDSAP